MVAAQSKFQEQFALRGSHLAIDEAVKNMIGNLPENEEALIETFEDLKRQGNEFLIYKLFSAALFLNPEFRHLAFRFGIFLHHNNDLNGAIRVYRKLLTDFPDFPEPASLLAGIYRHLDRLSDSIELLEMMRSRFPGASSIHAELALCYEMRGDRSSADAAHADACRLDPTNDTYRLRFLQHLRATGRISEAEDVALSVVSSNAKSAEFIRIAGDLAAARGDISLAITRYESVVTHFRQNRDFCINLAKLYLKSRNIEGAVKFCNDICDSDCSDITLLEYSYFCNFYSGNIDAARDLTLKCDAIMSNSRIFKARIRFIDQTTTNPSVFFGHWLNSIGPDSITPQDPRSSSGVYLLNQMTKSEMDSAIQRGTGLTLRELALQFESIGENCTFGLVQRAMGAEPISLLRYAGLHLGQLMDGLENEFVGIDDLDQLGATAQDGGDWDIVHQRYGLRYHTFKRKDSISERTFVDQQARHLKYLTRKLFDDLRDDAKIFVYTTWDPLKRDQLHALFDALKKRGGTRLLYVVEGFPVDLVEELSPGLYQARIDLLSRQEPDIPPDISAWANIMTRVLHRTHTK